MSDITTLRSIARDMFIKIDPKARVRGNTVLDEYINRWYMQVQKDGWNNRREQQAEWSLVTDTNTNSYSLPSDFLKFSVVSCEDNEIYPIERSSVLKANQINAEGKPIRYYIYGNNLGFYPKPQSSYNILYFYNKKLTKITESQPSELPDEFDFAICLYASYLACMSVEKREKAADVLWEYTNNISTLLTQYILTSDNYTYWLDRWMDYLPTAKSL